ncbi:hypothetical protein E5Q_00947 [Mixia osmundae IAM 14324]|uniref:Uncharacterized protein n=1 Tax=Mixia osmundae (strain CBS 9802 / IAM 14324 / JCM 22182 / KY 12970) TaxID=764103 RepID=G7DUN8_MIXOS|nr:hypothetical protein E5Q_00947 [Mixia osmundae IAM 14324]
MLAEFSRTFSGVRRLGDDQRGDKCEPAPPQALVSYCGSRLQIASTATSAIAAYCVTARTRSSFSISFSLPSESSSSKSGLPDAWLLDAICPHIDRRSWAAVAGYIGAACQISGFRRLAALQIRDRASIGAAQAPHRTQRLNHKSNDAGI